MSIRFFPGCRVWRAARLIVLLLAIGPGLVPAGCTPISELDDAVGDTYGSWMQQDLTSNPASGKPPSGDVPAAQPAPPSKGTPKGRTGEFEVISQGAALERSYAQIGDRTIPTGARFIDAEVNEFLRIVFEEILVVPFVTVGHLEGTVSLELGKNLPLSTWINAIDTQLKPLGGSLKYERGVFAAVKGGEAVFASSANVGFLPLTYADPADVAEILTDVFPDVKVIPAEAAGALVVLEFQRLALFLEISEFARTLDRGSLQSKTLFIHRLAQAEASDVVRELKLITDSEETAADTHRFARFLPIERMNAVLGVVPAGADVSVLRALIDSLDRVDTPRLAQSVRMVALKNSRAADVVVQIRALIGNGLVPKADPAVAPKPRTALSSPPGYFQRRRQRAAEEQANGALSESEEQYESEYADSQEPGYDSGYDSAQRRQYGPADQQGYRPDYDRPRDQVLGPSFRITADLARNAILMSGEPSTLNSVEELIGDIDREEVRQVYIETALVDIDLKEQLEYGLSSIISLGDAKIIPYSAAAAINPTFAGMNLLFDNDTIAGVLNLLSTVSDVRVISAPRLAMVNNSQAVLNVGDEVPVLTSQVTDTSNPNAIVNSVEFRETGVILRLAPTIMSDEAVLLDITQELTEARGTSPEAVQLTPQFSRRSLQTSLRIYSGDVIMLGGLKVRNASVTKDRIPIPILSEIFGSTGDTTDVREMVLLVRPVIVKDQQQMLRITQEVRERLNAIWGIDSIRRSIFDSMEKALPEANLDGAPGPDPSGALPAPGL